MKTVLSWSFAAALLAAPSVLPARAQAPAAPVPIEHFFENPVFSSAALSPDARSLAVRFGGKDTRDRLAVVDLDNNTIKVVAQFKSVDIGDFQWVNNERLVFDTNDRLSAPGDMRHGPGLYAVNRDGAGFMQLADIGGIVSVASRPGQKMLPWHTFLVKQKGAQDSGSVYVLSPRWTNGNRPEVEHVSLLKLDTLTGRSEHVKPPGKRTQAWLLDQRGEPRLAVTRDEDKLAVMYLDPATQAWRQLASFNGYTGGPGAFEAVDFGPDGTLFVRSHAGGDKAALHTFDLAANSVSPKPLVQLADFDFSGSLVTSRGKLLGIHYLSDAKATVWSRAATPCCSRNSAEAPVSVTGISGPAGSNGGSGCRTILPTARAGPLPRASPTRSASASPAPATAAMRR